MKTLRIRIALIWLCYLIIGVGFATDLIRYKPTMWVVVGCAFASLVLRYFWPRFPKRTHIKLQAQILIPLFALTVAAKFVLADPMRQQVVFIGLCLVVAAALIFQAYEDKRVWTSGAVVASYEGSLVKR